MTQLNLFDDYVLFQHRYPRNGIEHRFSATDWNSISDHQANSIHKLKAHQAELEDGMSIVRYKFDVSKPIEPQILKAKEQLMAFQEVELNSPKYRRSNWPNFLRVLDARDCGVTFQKIAKGIWPNLEKSPQSARDLHQSALNLRDNITI